MTEIVRNLTEEHRYNCCPRVAKVRGRTNSGCAYTQHSLAKNCRH